VKHYFAWRQKEFSELIAFISGWKNADDFDFGDISEWESPVCKSATLIISLLHSQVRERMEKSAGRALSLAEKAVSMNMPTVAALYLSIFGWVFRDENLKKAQELTEAVNLSNGIWFRQCESNDSVWKFVIDAFNKCLPAVKNGSGVKESTGTKSGRIVWMLSFRNQNMNFKRKVGDNSDDVYMCYSLTPCYRGPRVAQDGSADKELTAKALISGKYDKIFTETDRAVIAKLQAAESLRTYNYEIPYSVLEALCGHDALTVHNSGFGDKKPRRDPISLVKKDVPLFAKSTADNGLSIAVELWCMNVIEDYAVRHEADDTYALYSFPKATRSTMEVFHSFGSKGKIEIPKNGMDAVKPLLPRMAEIAPIQGELGSVGGVDMGRINGQAIPLVRIDFTNGILSLSVRVKPLDDLELLFHPGVGQPERMVVHKGRNVVLVRNLAEEKKFVKNLREAMGEFDSWEESDGEWRIDCLVHSLRALAALKGLGNDVRLEWRKGKPISITAPKPGSWKLSATEGMDFWFSVGGEFKLDDGKVMSIAELIAAYRGRQGEFLPFGDGEYLRLSSALLKRIEALEAAGRLKGKSLSVPSAAIPMLDGVLGGAEDGMLALPSSMEVKALAIREAFAKDVSVPSRLKAELRPYQKDGYVWLSRLASCGFGTCLADDMGLGKTVQLISLLLERSKDGPSLVVAPASVCGNWRSEIARFAPTLRTVMAWDEKADEMDFVKSSGPGDVVIAGYGLLVSRENQFASIDWNGVVLDEAQAIKNEMSKRAKAVKRLKAKFRVAATGTPVENRLTELWSISDFLNPGLLGSIGDFTKRFTIDGRATPALKKLVSPLIMRRVKRDVLDDLPEKTEITIPVILGDEERAGYEACRRMALESLQSSGTDNRISILAELTRLRRYCCHPSLVVGDGISASAKMDALLELLANLRENGHRALIFSQFTDYLAIVRKTVESQGWNSLYLDGQTPAAERSRLVDAFQRGEGDFFLISLKAGGMGLNLTAANYVILLDPWWNPAVENQAADRVHRIGQKNPVTVYRLIASKTVEERVIELHGTKRQIAEDVLDGSASASLTPDELMKLFQ
jgi:superfamily II DNA or RNA helicase